MTYFLSCWRFWGILGILRFYMYLVQSRGLRGIFVILGGILNILKEFCSFGGFREYFHHFGICFNI